MNLKHLLGVDFPIVQAPMAGVQASSLAIAVSNAGGLGSLPCAMLGPESLRAELEAVRAQSVRPVNINFFCHVPPTPDAARETAWRASLSSYYEEFDIDPSRVPAGPGRVPFDRTAAEILSEFKPRVVSFHFGLPSDDLLAHLRSWGARIMSSATTVEEACWLEARGVDVVIAQGIEAGGHRGMFLTEDLGTQLGTLALLPQVVRAVNVPVVAAGGIADARGVAAILALGAAGAQIGTSFLLCPEVNITPAHRAALQSRTSSDTVLTNLFTGRPSRGIVNRFIREQGPISPMPPAFPLAAAAVAPLRARAEALGSGDFSPLWSGQNRTGCKPIPAAELTRELAARIV